jgi:hypothetical protein
MATNDGGFIGQDGLNAPNSPTDVSATAGDTQATISFTAPSDVGGSAITGYSVQSDNGDGTFLYSYSVENAAYASKSLDVSSQDNTPSGIAFNSDGTKAFIAGQSNQAIYQYSLSTAYDISTATYDSVSFSVASQTTAPRDLCFKPDGTKMLIIESATDSILQYSLSTGFDLTTASYDSVSLDISGKDTNPQAVQFNDDGTSLYFVGTQNDIVYQYDMSSAYDLSTASDASKSFSVTNQEASPQGLFFKPDGTKFYIVGTTNDTVYQYSLSTAFDMSTASYDSISFDVSSQAVVPLAVIFNGDGSSMYIVDNTTDSIYQYTTGLDTYPTASPITVTGLTNGTSYTFNVWAINAFGWSTPSDASGSVTPAVPDIGLFFGGYNSSVAQTNNIDKIVITTTGNATDFGDQTAVNNGGAAVGSSTRGVHALGNDNSVTNSNVIEYVTFLTAGNATDFGDLTVGRGYLTSFSNSTRGCFAGGNTSDVIDYVTIATTGNAVDFGDLNETGTLKDQPAGLASSTRGCVGGGVEGLTSSVTNIIQYVTIASTGNSLDFGDLTASKRRITGAASPTRGLFMGGSGVSNVIEYITIATTGNAVDFGDLTEASEWLSALANQTRAVRAGGKNPTVLNTMDYVTIATTGNAADFGDLTAAKYQQGQGASNSHGGIA